MGQSRRVHAAWLFGIYRISYRMPGHLFTDLSIVTIVLTWLLANLGYLFIGCVDKRKEMFRLIISSCKILGERAFQKTGKLEFLKLRIITNRLHPLHAMVLWWILLRLQEKRFLGIRRWDVSSGQSGSIKKKITFAPTSIEWQKCCMWTSIKRASCESLAFCIIKCFCN